MLICITANIMLLHSESPVERSTQLCDKERLYTPVEQLRVMM